MRSLDLAGYFEYFYLTKKPYILLLLYEIVPNPVMISWFNNGIVQMTITLYITIFYPNVHIYLVVASTIFSPRLLLACTLLLLGKFTQIGLFHLLYALHSLSSMVWCMHACLLIFLQIFPIMNIHRVYNLL